MEFRRLSSDSEKLLYRIVDAFNPTQEVSNLFKNAIPEAKSGLRRLVMELEQYGYIDVVWADNIPCMVTPSISARKYKEQLATCGEQNAIHVEIGSTLISGKAEPKTISVAKEGTPQKTTSVAKEGIPQKTTSVAKGENAKPIIFISHRSTDKKVADMIADFFYGTGIPRDTVFCSSLPGNDVNEKISHEVKTAIKTVLSILSYSHGIIVKVPIA